MHTITVDDESLAVSAMQRTLAKVDPDGEHKGFYKVRDFLDYVGKHDDIDIAFIDVEMSGRDGISLTREVKRIAPNTNIVIYSGHRQYRADAMDEHVSSFIVKPVDEEKLRVAIENLRKPIVKRLNPKPMKIVTFGSFVAYENENKVMTFSSTRAMEIFAYLIDQCGYPVTSKEISSDVFAKELDSSVSKEISRSVIALLKDLENVGYGDVVIKQNKSLKINKSRVSCDLYNAMNGDEAELSAFMGEYLIDYSWAEFSESRKELENRGND
ncbi:MAG: response regulator [Ruminococcus sp.]|nr:response regulator [Ruminococcus sp.]